MTPREETVRTYLAAMARNDLDTVLQCFTTEGKVSSPVYGGVPVADFYRRLFADTATASVHLHTIFESQNKLAAHFTYHWQLKSGPKTTTDLVDLFDFAPESEKVTHLQIIFDTAKIGKA
jgi:ketosteroid isomerase-like protein